MKLFKEYHRIPLHDFLSIVEDLISSPINFKQVEGLAHLFKKFQSILQVNFEKAEKYIDILTSLKISMYYDFLQETKEIKIKELKLSEIKKLHSEISAKTDLLNKLNINLKKNQKRLQYMEEDFLIQKNQIEQLQVKRNQLKKEIQKHNAKKKECFDMINKLTREMELHGTKQQKKDDFTAPLLEEENMPISQKIRNLQQQARESQRKISQIKKELNRVNIKYEEIKPGYDILNKDYQTIRNSVEIDKKRIIDLKEKIKKEYELKKGDAINLGAINSLNIIRSSSEIENELQNINNKLGEITKNNPNIVESPSYLTQLKKKVMNFNSELDSSQLHVDWSLDEIKKSIYDFKRAENLLNVAENHCNEFLQEINLSFQFRLQITDDFDQFMLNFSYTRNNKEELTYNELTTPEKIYFVICLYLSLNLLGNNNTILFSNVFLPQMYNKRGSIFRTIRKILPIFQQEEELKNYSLIFIISNLVLKNPIQGIDVINI